MPPPTTLRKRNSQVRGATRIVSMKSYIRTSNRPMNGSVVRGATIAGWRPTAASTNTSEASRRSEYQNVRRWFVSIGRAYPAQGGAPAPHRISPGSSLTASTTVARGSRDTASIASIASVDEAPAENRNENRMQPPGNTKNRSPVNAGRSVSGRTYTVVPASSGAGRCSTAPAVSHEGRSAISTAWIPARSESSQNRDRSLAISDPE